MMNKIKYLLLVTVWMFPYFNHCLAQNNRKLKKTVAAVYPAVPDLPGYKTLKCDFHMHTVFSDGRVWPNFRVDEALLDGLDAISLTEHTDFVKYGDDMKRDGNRAYQIALDYAKGKNLIIINGGEISPRVPPYHNNAIFLKDANLPFDYMKSAKNVFIMKDKIDHKDLMAPFLEAQKQGAFVFYNHPGGMPEYVVQDTAVFTDFHKELFKKGILKGIEVVNSANYNVRAHELAMQYDLTMVCNTDEHADNNRKYKNSHRPMTLVFAKEKTEASIKEAMLAKKTALYFDDYIVARQPEAEAFFKAAITASAKRDNRKKEPVLEIKFKNSSDVPFNVEITSDYKMMNYPLGQVTLKAQGETTITFRAMWKYPDTAKLNVKVNNIIVSPREALKTSFILETKQ